MKQFNLDEYLKNPSRKMVTRDGRKVTRVLCTDAKSTFPFVVLIKKDNDKDENVCSFTKNGNFCESTETSLDLFFADDIPEFKPYDRVLTRGHSGLPWKANLFSNFKKQGDNTIAVCLKGDYLLNDIIPFDENKVGKIE